MGHKGSQKHAEEASKDLVTTSPADISAENLNDVLAETEELELREKVAEHTDVAVKALKEVAESGEPDSARVSAAKGILEYGHGKPAQSKPHTGDTGGGVTINIIRLSGEKSSHTFNTIAQDVEDAQEVAEVVKGDVARRLLEGTE
jgi:hypothetical protein